MCVASIGDRISGLLGEGFTLSLVYISSDANFLTSPILIHIQECLTVETWWDEFSYPAPMEMPGIATCLPWKNYLQEDFGAHWPDDLANMVIFTFNERTYLKKKKKWREREGASAFWPLIYTHIHMHTLTHTCMLLHINTQRKSETESSDTQKFRSAHSSSLKTGFINSVTTWIYKYLLYVNHRFLYDIGISRDIQNPLVTGYSSYFFYKNS